MTERIFPIGPFRARARYRKDGDPRALELSVPQLTQDEAQHAVEDGALTLRVLLRRTEVGLRVEAEVEACADGVTLDSIEPLRLEEPTLRSEELAVFHQGWQSWSGTSALLPGEPEPRPRGQFIRDVITSPTAPRLYGKGHLSSELVVAIEPLSGGRAVLVGLASAASQHGGFEIETRPGARPSIEARLPFDGAALRRDEPRRAEPLDVAWGADSLALLEQWAERLGSTMAARIPARSARGWCSWYYYFTKITDAAIRENLERLHELRSELPISLFQIDDGYQAAIGDWTRTNAKFPDGMAPLAQEAQRLGFVPGLWLAPFIARPESELLQQHPDWFMRNEAGEPRYALYNPMWGKLGTAKALDTTNPQALDWLASVFRTVTRDWGFRFVKIDFLYAAALPGERYDPTVTGAEALRRGLQTIRDAVGDGVHVLGCGCPLGPAVGLVDSMRVGIDVAPYWSDLFSRFVGRDYDMISTKNALRNVLTRAFLHRRLWQNDPDCLLVRERKSRLTLDEVRSLATLAALSGGTMLLSDKLASLPPQRLAIAQRAIAINAEISQSHPRCLDLMASSFPTTLWAPRDQGGGWLAVLNPGDRPQRLSVWLGADPALHDRTSAVDHLTDEWTGVACPIVDGQLSVPEVPAHGVRLLEVR